MSPFRFAVQASGATDGHAWRELARRVEGCGYSTLTVPDHFDGQWGPFTALCVAAEATTTLRVGALVLDNDYRHPIHVAKEFATLDLVSQGRVEVGLGAGWLRQDYDTAGITYDCAGVRIDRLGEAVTIIKMLWSTGRADFVGRHYQVEGLQGSPMPYRVGGPPILIGGGGRKVLSLGGREADIVGFTTSLSEGALGPGAAQGSLAERFAERVSWVAEAAGSRFGELELQLHTFAVLVMDDPEPVLAPVAAGFGLSVEQVREVPMVLAGPVPALVETLQRRREEYGFSYVVIHDHEADSFAPVVAALAGT